MNNLVKKLVDNYAKELLIILTQEEKQQILNELEFINQKYDTVKNILIVNKVKPMTHCLDDFKIELREDVAEKSLSTCELFSNCKQVFGKQIKLPKVVKKWGI